LKVQWKISLTLVGGQNPHPAGMGLGGIEIAVEDFTHFWVAWQTGLVYAPTFTGD
jgi:hypothetical protein